MLHIHDYRGFGYCRHCGAKRLPEQRKEDVKKIMLNSERGILHVRKTWSGNIKLTHFGNSHVETHVYSTSEAKELRDALEVFL